MSKWKGKLARRIMAIVLSGAMVMSNMSAYAAELVPETSVESVEEVSDAKEQAGAENEENGEDVASGGGASTPDGSTPEESTPAPDGSTPEVSAPEPEESKPEESTPAPDGSTPEESTPEESSEAETSSVEESSETETSSNEESSETETSSDDSSEGTYIYTLTPGDLVGDYGDYTLESASTLPDITMPSGSIVGTNTFFKLLSKNVKDPEDNTKEIFGSVKLRQNGGNYFYIELSKAASGQVEFTVENTATVTVEAASTGGSNWSAVGLIDSQGTAVNEKDGKIVVKGTGKGNNFVFENLDPGTYAIVSPYRADGTVDGETGDISTKGRGLRLISLKVNTTAEGQARADFSTVAAPKVTSAVLNADDETKIDVEAEGLVGYDGGDKITLVMTDADNNEVGKWVSRVGGSKHSFSIKPNDSVGGIVTLTAKLSRSGEEDKIGTETKEIEYNAPLKAPSNLQISDTSEGDKISVDFSWVAAAKATSYNVTVKEDVAEGATEVGKTIFEQKGITDTKVTINEGLEQGKTYVFSVVSVKSAEGAEDEVSDPADKTYTVPKPVAPPSGSVTTYTFNAGEYMVEAADKAPVEAGTKLGTDNYFKAVQLDPYEDKGAMVQGTIVKRGSEGKTKALEISKYTSAGIQFTAKGTADLTLRAASTGSGNLSSIALIDSSGKIIKPSEVNLDSNSPTDKQLGELEDGSVLVWGNETRTNLIKYTGLKAGTYTAVSPKNTNADRNAWIVSMSVDEAEVVTVVTDEYVFNASEYMVEAADKAPVEAGTKFGTDNYFKAVQLDPYEDKGAMVQGTIVKRGSEGKTKALEISKYTSAGIQFTAKGTADLTLRAASTGSGNLSSIALIDSSGKIIKPSEVNLDSNSPTDKQLGELEDGSVLVWGNETRTNLIKYTGLKAGTYTAVSPKNTNADRNAWIVSMSVSDTYTSSTETAKTTVFDAATVFTEALSADLVGGKTISYVNDYFTVLYGPTSSVDGHKQSWDDGYNSVYRINFRGDVSTTANAIKFTSAQDETTVSIWWRPNAEGKCIKILNESGEQVAVSPETQSQNGTSYITKFKLNAKGTYYIGGNGSNCYIYKLSVTEGHVDAPVDWSEVKAPVILSAEQVKDAEGALTDRINVKVQAVIHEFKGCEKINVEMYDSADATEPVDTVSSARETETDTTVTFNVTKSGNYYFVAKAIRASESTTKDSERFAMTTPFVLPLSTTTITRATNDGTGNIEIAYGEIPEADKYIATAIQVTKNEDGTYTPVEGAEPKTVESVVTAENKATTATFTGLTIGQYYAFSVHGLRGAEEGKESEQFYKIVKDVKEQIWDYAVYGESASTDTKKCYYSGDANDNEVTVWSLSGSGKVVPASTDGLSFYYTKIDKDTNFVLEATAVVDEWTYSNGQEGFGLMVADTVGEIEPPKTVGTKFWNNSYMAVATKMEYYWNGSTVLPATAGPGEDRTRYNMYLGLGSIARTGVTDEWKTEEAAGATIPSKFVSEMLSLEHEAATQGLPSGNYNIIGNKVSGGTAINVEPLLTEIKLRIEKNNTGYFITYIDKNGEETVHKFYEGRSIADKDYANQSLLQIDKDNVYAGFFAARNAKVTFKDITFTTSSVDEGGEPEERPLVNNTPNYTILSGSVSNTPDYDINFSTNWNGKLSVKDSAGRELLNEEYFEYLAKTQTTVLTGGSYVDISMLDKFFEYEKDEEGKRIAGTEMLKAEVKAIIPINDDVNKASKLAIGGNQFTVTFTPDRTWHKNDDELQVLTSYDTSVQLLNVSYRQYGEEGSNIYAAPNGKATGDGTTEAPLDIFTAVKYAQAGQTIVLLKGTYSLKKPLVVERGVDGTADKPIRMIAEPGSYDRTKPFEPSGVVIDFNGVASGMTMAGDYWYFRGFDVTNSSDGNKGIQVSGSHNVLDQVNAYYNGNTGIQISRYKGADIDKSDDWPAYNTILNCTSYLNADSGHEDADGFAAKLTIGDGNVFDGCVAAYNADDGWDFFAKSESGPIGQVIIKNSVAYRNGYMLLDEKGNLDAKGTEAVGKGNGNGFKMGGENIRGYHLVINSYTFLNKAKGIDCNSCPDIQSYNCISFNNLAANIRFETAAKQTAFRARNTISFRTKDVTPESGAEADTLKPVTPSGETDLNDFRDASNFYWDQGSNAAVSSDKKVSVTADWFKSLEYKGITTVSRNADGTVNMGDFLAFSDKADTSVFVKIKESTNASGAKIYETADTAEGIDGVPGVGGQPSDDNNAVVDKDKDTSGNIVSGDDEDLSGSDIWTDEEFEQLDVNGNTLKILLDIDHNSEGYYTDYTGIALKPAVRVAYGLNELIKKNYSVSYKNTKNAYELRPGDEGFDKKLAPTVVIKGKGNYAGEYNLYFVINRINLSSDKVTSADITTVATGKSQKINPVVTFDGKKLSAKDYTISRRYTEEPVKAEDGTETGEYVQKEYSGAYESAGTYFIELKAVEGGNFEGTKIIEVKVLSEAEAASKTPMSKAKVAKIPDQIYDGTAHRPAVSVTGLTPSTFDEQGNYVAGDYDVAYYNNTDIGIASVVLTGNLEKGYYGTKTVTFKTLAKPFNVKNYDIVVKYGKDYYRTDEQYKGLIIPSTGSAVTFSNVAVEVKNEGSKNVRLTEGVDYTVSYKGNNKAGSASIVIKGMGDFKGSMARTFKITPYEITASNTTVEPIGSQTYVKGGVKPSVIVKVNGKVVSAKNYSVSYKNNNKVGTATVSITGKNLLKGSLKEIGSFEITAKNLRSTNIIAENVYYGTAKTNTEPGNQIAYVTKLAVKDGNKNLSLNSDYAVTYYEEDGTPIFNYSTGELKFKKMVTVKNEDGTETEKEEIVSATPLAKNSKIAYNGSNKTIYAVITGGKNGLYTGASFATYKVVGKNDIKTAKITKITDIYTYNDGLVAAPKLEVKIQNRHLEGGKYVKDTEFTTLKLNQDYEIVNLKNNDRAGTCTITLKGIGYYAGTTKVSFKIEKKDLTAWNAYLAHAVVTDITVNVDEADVVKGGKYEGAFTFDDIEIITKDEEGKDVVTTETSPLKKAAAGKIYTVGTKESITLEYGKDYSATTYSDNKVDASKLVFDENGYAYQTATVTIKGEGNFTGSRTIRFTIKVKKTATA